MPKVTTTTIVGQAYGCWIKGWPVVTEKRAADQFKQDHIYCERIS